MKDMKAALGNGSKPDITHVRTALKVYIARACEYGNAKYERSNYMRPTEEGSTKANFLRFRNYLRSVQSHVDKALDKMELHQAMDPDLKDEKGMRSAAFAPDPDDSDVGPSMLPHVAHAAAGLMMGIVQATLYGLLPADPGQPWTEKKKTLGEPVILGLTPKWGDPKVETRGAPDYTRMPPVPQAKPKDTKEFEHFDVCPHDSMIGMSCEKCEGGYARRVESD